MAGTYKKIYLQIVFAVKYRKAMLRHSWRQQLFAYMSGIITQRGHFTYAVNGYDDHVHLFFDYKGHELISDLVREIKKASNKYIKESGFIRSGFAWQGGYGVFSHGYRERDIIIRYIQTQEQRHARETFRAEYYRMLQKYNIDFQDEYIFQFFDNDHAA